MRILITENQRNLLVITEDFKTQREKYHQQGFGYDDIDRFLRYFRNIKDKKYKQLFDPIQGFEVPKERRHDIDAYRRFEELVNIVTYVRGQVDTNDYDEEKLVATGNLVFEDEIVEVRQAFSDKMCIEYLKPYHYSWCISRTHGNAYYSYRNKSHRPTFYFVKLKDRTEKELERHPDHILTSENVVDKWHFFVLQIGNNDKFYITSAKNEGENSIEWSTITSTIDNRLEKYKNLFKSVTQHELDIATAGMSDQQFCRAPYRQKLEHLNTNTPLNTTMFGCLPDDLKAHYINLKHQLTPEQLGLIGYGDFHHDKLPLLDRYKVVINRVVQEQLKRSHGASIFPITLKFFDEETIQMFNEFYISRKGKLSVEQFKLAPKAIQKYYIESGNQLSDEMISSLGYDLREFYVTAVNKTVMNLIDYIVGNSWAQTEYNKSFNFNNQILASTLKYLNTDTWKKIGELFVHMPQTLDADHFMGLHDSLKKYYLRTEEISPRIYEYVVHDTNLSDFYILSINARYREIFSSEVSSYLPNLNILPLTIGLLDRDNLLSLQEKIKSADRSQLVRFKKHLQDAKEISLKDSHTNNQFRRFFDYLDEIIRIKTPPPSAPFTMYQDEIIPISNDNKLLLQDETRNKLEETVVKINNESENLPQKLVKFYPFLRVYYDRQSHKFTNKREIIVDNIMRLYEKDILSLAFLHYYISKFSKAEINTMIEIVKNKVPGYTFSETRMKIENWYIKNKKKQLGMNESKITLQEILNIL